MPTRQGKVREIWFFFKVREKSGNSVKLSGKLENLQKSGNFKIMFWGAQWLSGRVLDSRPRGRGFEPHRPHCVVSLSKNINPSLVLVQPRKTRPFITERLLMGRKESNQTNNQTKSCLVNPSKIKQNLR